MFAGGIALVSQSAKAHWLVLRRGAQLRQARERLAEQGSRLERANEVLKVAEARFGTLCDGLSTMIAFIDRNERCRYHNSAFERWCGHGKDAINGVALRGVVDGALYENLQPHTAAVLAGSEQRYEASWSRIDGRKEHALVTLLPYPAATERPDGFYLILDCLEAFSPASARDGTAGAGGPSTILKSFARLAVAEPRTRLMRALEDNKFILFAQKIEPVSRNARHPDLHEILLRLREDEQRLLPPGGFIPIAERHNLMGEIDR